MTVQPRSINAITLARMGPSAHQVTFWRDGVARFDGRSGQRQGAWNAQIDEAWFARASKLARNLEPGPLAGPEQTVTLVLDTIDSRIVYEASDADEPAEFWTLGTLIDGMCQRAQWAPLDTLGKEDFTRFAAGTPLLMSAGEAIATGYGLDGELLVMAGAQASVSTFPSLQDSYQQLRSRLIDDGDLVLVEDKFRLIRHLRFGSPSAAASVLAGSNTSGPRAWRDSNGRTWSQLDLDV